MVWDVFDVYICWIILLWHTVHLCSAVGFLNVHVVSVSRVLLFIEVPSPPSFFIISFVLLRICMLFVMCLGSSQLYCCLSLSCQRGFCLRVVG